jgi:hypothetical protein
MISESFVTFVSSVVNPFFLCALCVFARVDLRLVRAAHPTKTFVVFASFVVKVLFFLLRLASSKRTWLK